jgi:hypothetical protein
LVAAAAGASVVELAAIGLFVDPVMVVLVDAALAHEDDFAGVGILAGAVHGLADEAVERMQPGLVYIYVAPAQALDVSGVESA